MLGKKGRLWLHSHPCPASPVLSADLDAALRHCGLSGETWACVIYTGLKAGEVQAQWPQGGGTIREAPWK